MLKAKGGNPFMSLQLPQAIITLKQGAGRLIRDEFDKGVLMICDLRIISKPYGKKYGGVFHPLKGLEMKMKRLIF